MGKTTPAIIAILAVILLFALRPVLFSPKDPPSNPQNTAPEPTKQAASPPIQPDAAASPRISSRPGPSDITAVSGDFAQRFLGRHGLSVDVPSGFIFDEETLSWERGKVHVLWGEERSVGAKFAVFVYGGLVSAEQLRPRLNVLTETGAGEWDVFPLKPGNGFSSVVLFRKRTMSTRSVQFLYGAGREKTVGVLLVGNARAFEMTDISLRKIQQSLSLREPR